MATYYWRGGTGSWNSANTGNWAATSAAATFTASRSTTVLTVTAVASGTIAVGDTVWHTSGTAVGKITSFGTGSGGTGTYNMDTSGTLTSRTMSTATIAAGPPTSADDVIFDVDSNVGTANFTVTSTTTAGACKDCTISGLDGTMTWTLSTAPSIFGNLAVPATSFAFSSTASITFAATSGTKTITSNGQAWSGGVIFDGVGGTWQLVDALNSARPATLTNGTLDLNDKTLTCSLWQSNNANTRVLAFGSSGKIVASGGNNVTPVAMATMTNFSYTGTPVIELTYAGSTGTRTIQQGSTAGGTEARALPLRVTGGTDAFQITGVAGDVNLTGYTGQLSSYAATYYGDLTFDAGTTVASTAGTPVFGATSGTQVITTNGAILAGAGVTFNGVGGTFQLADTLAGDVTVTLFTLTNGTLDLNGQTLKAFRFNTATGTKNITWSGGKIEITATTTTAFNNAAPTNFTTTAGSGHGTIDMKGALAKTFVGGGSAFNATLNQGGAGDLTITGANTFYDITNTTQPASVLFTASTTTTFTNAFSLSGIAANLITIGSVTAASHTLSLASGTVNVSYCTISRSTALGGATWDAFTSNGNVDGGNNSGWIFTNTYNESITETASAVDTVSSSMVIGASVVETASAADTVSAVRVLSDSVSESVSAVDTVSATFEFFDEVVEAVTAIDTVAAPQDEDSEVVESAPAVDTVSAAVVMSVVVAETATAADTVTASRITSAAVVETANAVDTVTAQAVLHAAVAEVASAEDTVSCEVFRLKWFLSFADVAPPPVLGPPGGPGKLFGDLRYEVVE